MKWRPWHLLDLRDGRKFDFTVERFFLALRQLELSPTAIIIRGGADKGFLH